MNQNGSLLLSWTSGNAFNPVLIEWDQGSSGVPRNFNEIFGILRVFNYFYRFSVIILDYDYKEIFKYK
jgi:hypothetical protein